MKVLDIISVVLIISGITCRIVLAIKISNSLATGAHIFLMIGDSITQLGANPSLLGFQSQVSQDYMSVYRGLSGWTTKKWCPLLPKLAREWQHKPPSLITIFLGANDAALPNITFSVPLEDYGTNLQYMA
ncbi:hypothetical protein THRCLA_08957 [Thraustotheca clavata]|uniref:SGNH hydrolase-type esterase domain-containing protein n=1 Tax=Thraustotheca clavata TaxID=74557 RepID=A0A1V9Z0I1_9STRA|nr:hypothetical protein THRCLA_08957 [Thraustotheca clavata]